MTTYYVVIALTFFVAVLGTSRVPATPDGSEGEPERIARTSPAAVALVTLILAGVSALRWRVGTDYVSYSNLYDEYINTPASEWGWDTEPGIRILAKIGAQWRDDYAVMFALAAIITVGLIVGALGRHSKAFAFSILLYILTATWQGSFNAVRQYLACAILFAGHRFILERRLIPWVLVVAVAHAVPTSSASWSCCSGCLQASGTRARAIVGARCPGRPHCL